MDESTSGAAKKLRYPLTHYSRADPKRTADGGVHMGVDHGGTGDTSPQNLE